ncbi:hypothetical protein ABEF95_011678 [Exophiala dermatitidis]
MAEKYAPPQYPPPSHSGAGDYQSPQAPSNGMVYQSQDQYDMSRGGPQQGGYFPQQQPYYGPPQGYNSGPGGPGYYPPQQPPTVVYEREKSSSGGICADECWDGFLSLCAERDVGPGNGLGILKRMAIDEGLEAGLGSVGQYRRCAALLPIIRGAYKLCLIALLTVTHIIIIAHCSIGSDFVNDQNQKS